MIKQQLQKYRVEHLHYMTPIQNVPFMLALGILSYNSLQKEPKLKQLSKSIADPFVQYRRACRRSMNGRPLHDYVPLYFATHTPMQYVCTQRTTRSNPTIYQSDLVFIEVDAMKIFKSSGIIFTDGNAAANETRFYTNPAGLAQLDWAIINTPNCYSPKYKRKKSAEVLVPDIVPVKFFKRIVFFSHKTADAFLNGRLKELKKTLSKHNRAYLDRCKYEVDPTHYY